MPSAGILTPVIVTDGGLGNGSSSSSFQLKKDQIKAIIVQPRKDQIVVDIVKVGIG